MRRIGRKYTNNSLYDQLGNMRRDLITLVCIHCQKEYFEHDSPYSCENMCSWNCYQASGIHSQIRVKCNKSRVGFAVKYKPNRTKLAKGRQDSQRSSDKVLKSDDWLYLKYKALVLYGPKCMACLKTDQQLHVDHIKPRNLYPELTLDMANLQILCRDCNKGKSDLDCTDWRTAQQRAEALEFKYQLSMAGQIQDRIIDNVILRKNYR